MIKNVLIGIALVASTGVNAQYWQQRVKYDIDVEMDVEKHQYKGVEKLTYFNNSPDTLNRVFFHLYNNAFHPGSMMDMKGRITPDPEKGVLKIANLSEEEEGYLHAISMTQDGKEIEFIEHETILEVTLAKAILPGKKTEIVMEFDAQSPNQCRRSGRYNSEEVAYSMSQWYPKICEYDRKGWHANPYIGKEFYGVWGDFNVSISIDSAYVLGGTGKVTNAKEVKNNYGGYEGKPETEMVTWRFEAKNVHDFVWAADKEYLHDVVEVGDDLTVHLLYKNDTAIIDNWVLLGAYMEPMFNFINKKYGKYGFDTFSVIQGGDRGMEYPMATLISGNRNLGSLIGVTVHELMHSWYYMALGTNESAYPWMDEGFTSYTSDFVMNYLLRNDSISIPDFSREKSRILAIMKSEKDELLATPADHYATDLSYGINAYNRGSMYLHQLAYIIGQDQLDELLRRYYKEWGYKHPGPEDFIHLAEKVSGMELKWYNDYYIRSLKKIDYAVASYSANSEETLLTLQRRGDFIMPVDMEVNLVDGSTVLFNIPLGIMYGQKPNPGYEYYEVLPEWSWVEKDYRLILPFKSGEISSIILDPQEMTLDLDRDNNFMFIESVEGADKVINQ